MKDIYLALDIFTLTCRIVSLTIILLFVFPMIFRQFQVKDYLLKLRKRLFHFGITVLLLNSFAIYAVINRILFDMTMTKNVTYTISVFNGFGFLMLAYLGYKIYHEQYVDNPKVKEKNDNS